MPKRGRVGKEKNVNGNNGNTLPSAWTTWYVPAFTADSMQAGSLMHVTQESLSDGSNGAYEAMLDSITDDNADSFECAIHALTESNRWLYTILMALTFNAWFCAQSEYERVRRQEALRFIFELIMGWLIRLYNTRCWVLPNVILSLWALRSKVPTPFWDLLTRWRLLYSKDTTTTIATDLGLRVQRPCFYPDTASRVVAISVGDNCLCKFPTSFEGIRADGDGTQNYLFINWLLAPVAYEDVPAEVDPGEWLDNSFTTIALPLNINIHLRHRQNLGQHMHCRCGS